MLEQTNTQLVMLYYMDSKKHLPGRIVPLGFLSLGKHVSRHMFGLRTKAQDTKLLGINVIINEDIFCSVTEYSLKETSFRLHPV